jgi:methionyl-tRNA synthetase
VLSVAGRCRAQTEICQGIFTSIHERGRTTIRTQQQLYSTALDKFLADRFVVGTCPKCGYTDARGDQCDSCGRLLDPTELRNARCKFSGTEPELRATTHLFIDLPQLAERLQQYVTTTSELVRRLCAGRPCVPSVMNLHHAVNKHSQRSKCRSRSWLCL